MMEVGSYGGVEKFRARLSAVEQKLIRPIQPKSEAEALEDIERLTKMGFVLCPGGVYEIGAPVGLRCIVEGHRRNEVPIRCAKIDPFYVSRTTVSNIEYEQFDPEHSRTYSSPGDRNPVTCLTYGRALRYANWLNEQTGLRFMLPTYPQMIAAMAPSGWRYPDAEDRSVKRRLYNVYNSFPERYPGGEKAATLEVDDPIVPMNDIGLFHPTGNVSVFTFGHYQTEGGTWGAKSNGAYCLVAGGNFRTCPHSTRVVTRGIADVAIVTDTIGIRLVHPDPMQFLIGESDD